MNQTIPLSMWFNKNLGLAVPLIALPSLPNKVCEECGQIVNIYRSVIETTSGTISLYSMVYKSTTEHHPSILCDKCLDGIWAFKFVIKTTDNVDKITTFAQSIDIDLPCHSCHKPIKISSNDLCISETRVVLLSPIEPLYCADCLGTINVCRGV
jgi:hypothetical protein